MKPHTYLYLTKSVYANQIFEIFRQRTGCKYDFKMMNIGKKILTITGIINEPLKLVGDTWEDVSYQLNAYMNTEEFKKDYRLKDKYEHLERMM